jgi:hypothetical protein
VAALVSLAAFAIVLAEPALSSRRRVAPATADEPCPRTSQL